MIWKYELAKIDYSFTFWFKESFKSAKKIIQFLGITRFNKLDKKMNFEDINNQDIFEFFKKLLEHDIFEDSKEDRSYCLVEDLTILVKFYEHFRLEDRFNQSKAIN